MFFLRRQADAGTFSSERLRAVPDVLESLISEKRLLQAAVLLIRSLKLINKQDMLEVGAVSDLRSYLNAQEVVRFTNISGDKQYNKISNICRHLERFWSMNYTVTSI